MPGSAAHPLPFAGTFLVAVALWSTPALAQAPDAGTPSPEELEEIERALSTDAAATETPQPPPRPIGAAVLQSLNPDIAVILDAALAAFSADEPLQTGAHDPQRNGFNFQQLEMTLGAAVDPYFRFDANLVFGQFGVEVEEAYATTLALPYGLQARAGQFLTRFGRLNPTHPHSWWFVDQPFALGRVFGGEGNRGVGTELSWLAPLPWYLEVVGSASDAAGEGTARSFYGATDLGVFGPADVQLTGAVKQFFELSPDLSLSFGLSAATGPNPTGHANRTDVYGADLYLRYRPLAEGSSTVVALQLEYLLRRRQVPRDVLADSGGYAQLLWRFAPRWETAARYEYGAPARATRGTGALDALDPEWVSDRHRASVQLTFFPTEFSRLRLQGASDIPTWRDRPIYAAFLNLEVAVGAHGAHAF